MFCQVLANQLCDFQVFQANNQILTFTKYCTFHKKWHVTFTKYCACHEKWYACLILVTYETSFTMRGATNVTLQTHQILRLPRKMTTQHLAKICGKQLKRHFQCAADPSRIRDGSETVPVRPQPAAQQSLLFALRTTILHWKIQHFALRLAFQIWPSTAPASKSDTGPPPSKLHLPRKVTPSTAPATKSDAWPSPSTAPATKSDTWPSPSIAPATKSNTWPSPSIAPATKSDTWPSPSIAPAKVTRMLDPRHIWNVIYNARSNKCHPPNSPNTAPATQNDHPTSGKNLRKTAKTSFPMRGRSETVPRPLQAGSETVPRMNPSSTRRATEVTFRAQDERYVLINTTFRAPAIFPNSPSTAPATKSDTWPSPSPVPATKSDTWPSPSIAPSTKSDTWPSPSIAPATKSDTWPSPSIAPATKSDTWPSPSTAPAITWLYYY